MPNMEQLEANISTYETDEPLSREEFDTLVKLADEKTRKGDFPVRLVAGGKD